jgi:hypothetical protein
MILAEIVIWVIIDFIVDQSDSKLRLRYDQERADERIFRNGWMTDISGKAGCTRDLSAIDLAATQRDMHPFGAFLILNEDDAEPLQLQSTDSQEKYATTQQRSIAKELASLNPHINQLPYAIEEAGRKELPALFLADMAIVPSGLYFREGRWRGDYNKSLAACAENMGIGEESAHRAFNLKVRDHQKAQEANTFVLSSMMLDNQQREIVQYAVDPELNSLYAHAQTISRINLPLTRFVIQTAREALNSL